MTHQPSPKFWMPRYQADMSYEELEYRKMLALDQTILVRETPQSSVEKWQEFFAKVNR